MRIRTNARHRLCPQEQATHGCVTFDVFEVLILKNNQSSVSKSSFTRRQWLGRVPPSALAALLAGGFSGEQGVGSGQEKSDPAATNPGVNNPGADASRARVYNIRKYGAKGDGIALDTPAVQAAIDACHQDGGGTVLVPAGTFQ